MHSTLTKAGWLTPERATAWCRMLAVCQVAWLLALIVRSHGMWQLPSDFGCFWTASKLALRTNPGVVYDPGIMAAFEHGMHFYGNAVVEAFMYPPSFLLLCLPLALMTPGVAAVVFIAAGLAPFVLCLRRLLPWRWSWLPILAFPGVMVTAGSGQNGLLTAACFGGGTLLLEQSPLMAGMCLGLLSCKPHLAVLVPVALIAARRWRALAGAAISALGLAAFSGIVLGAQVWIQFPQALEEARDVMSGSLVNPSQLQSLFGAALILHAPLWLCIACQAGFSLAMVGLLINVVRGRPGGRAEGATLTIASLAASPYLMDYDLAALAIPLAWLVAEASCRCWRPWEKYAAMAVYMMPLLTRGVAEKFGLPLAPVLLAGFATVIMGRAANASSVVAAQQGAFAEI